MLTVVDPGFPAGRHQLRSRGDVNLVAGGCQPHTGGRGCQPRSGDWGREGTNLVAEGGGATSNVAVKTKESGPL